MPCKRLLFHLVMFSHPQPRAIIFSFRHSPRSPLLHQDFGNISGSRCTTSFISCSNISLNEQIIRSAARKRQIRCSCICSSGATCQFRRRRACQRLFAQNVLQDSPECTSRKARRVTGVRDWSVGVCKGGESLRRRESGKREKS